MQKAQVDMGQLLYVIPVIIVAIFMIATLPSLFCSGEHAQINDLTSQLNNCQNNLGALNESVAKCNESINAVSAACQEKISNATQKCETNLGFYVNLFTNYKYLFVIYNIIFVFWLSISFGFYLKFIDVKISFGKQIDSFIETHRKIRKVMHWALFLFWILSLIGTIVFFYFLVAAKP